MAVLKTIAAPLGKERSRYMDAIRSTGALELGTLSTTRRNTGLSSQTPYTPLTMTNKAQQIGFLMTQQDEYGRPISFCRICNAQMAVEMLYEKIGVCCDCAKKIANAVLVQHSGVPDPRLDPEGYAAFIQKHSKRPVYRKRPIPNWLRTQVFERDEYACLHCGVRKDLRADHIVPESKGGQTVLENLQTLCARCNSVKGDR